MGDLLMNYKDELIKVMELIALKDEVLFMGYNTACGHRFNGTLAKVPQEKCLELPVAENLIMGLAMGVALEGYRPIVCLERMDFLWACADAIVNHLDKVEELGWSPLNVIIRTCVGTDTPLNPGCQHKGDYVDIFTCLLGFPVYTIKTAEEVKPIWDKVMESTGPVMVVEYRSEYNKPTLPTVPSKSAEA